MRRSLTSLLILTLCIGLALAIYAFPDGPVNLRAQTCNTEIASATPENFAGACTGTYPAACPTDRISCNDATTQTATVSGNNQYMGIRISEFNNTETNCGGITNVKVCYEWWSSSASISTCTVKVDANGGLSYSTASTTCPGTTANPGVICTDVTSLETWTCENFFTAAGTRALAYLQVLSTTGGAKTLSVDTLFFNVTYVLDATAPSVNILYPLNTNYTSYIDSLNTSISDPNLQSCWWTNNSGTTNYTFTCGQNVTGMVSSLGTNTWTVWANDSYGNYNSSSVTFDVNLAPTINNITATPNPSGLSALLTIRGNGITDANSDPLNFYCSETSSTPTDNTLCSGGGNLTAITSPYNASCIYYHNRAAGNYTVYCRAYDGLSYSSTVNLSYQVLGISLNTNITNIAGDTAPSYFDTINDGRTDIILAGSSEMSCRWSSSDLSYSSMVNNCAVVGAQANCSVNDISSQGFYNRYISCQDSYGNSQTASDNLDAQFYLDYTSPTTTDSSNTSIHAPNYEVIITESDNVDADPTTYYCTSTTAGCTPANSIDNGGAVSYTSSNRGINYLRYYSLDDAGNVQETVNKTISINRLPTLTSASDNAGNIRGGSSVTVTTTASDSDAGQTITLYVCKDSGATASGCTYGTYCSAIGSSNPSCGFASEEDSATHTWYAYVYDSLGEAASANPLTGSYTTDSTNPTITIVSPSNTTYTQNSITLTITSNEPLSQSWYSLDDGATNISMTNISIYTYTKSNGSIPNGFYTAKFWINDSYGNSAEDNVSFTIDDSLGDTTAPEITIISPINNTYYTGSTRVLNITSDENLSWAGYKLNSDAVVDLGNVSKTEWNKTVTIAEGQNTIIFYANDSSTNKNQASKTITVNIDLTDPVIDLLSCTDSGDSSNLNCTVQVSDNLGLDYIIIENNATGIPSNSSQIDLSGTSNATNYTIYAANTTPGGFITRVYVYDLSSRSNSTTDQVTITDDTSPLIANITYSPNNTQSLDPGVRVYVNATIVENYNISSVMLMYKNTSVLEWSYISMANNSALVSENNSSVIYNASFLAENGTWSFKINATDSAGNQNVSENYTLIVENDTSQNITTTVPTITSITYAQRTENSSLGYLILNNTGDTELTFNVTLYAGAIENRLNLNYTNTSSYNYTVSPGSIANLTVLVNSTAITSGLYSFNITASSEAGNENLERTINIQTSAGPYLVVAIDTYSASVTKGQTGVELSATVTNLGTQDATGSFLNWTIPSEFSVTSGNISRYLGTIPIGVSSRNTITVSVNSSSEDKNANIIAEASSINADSDSDTKAVTIGSPVTITRDTSTGGTSGGGDSSSSGDTTAQAIKYYKTLTITRGSSGILEIPVTNNKNYSINDISLRLDNYPGQYVEVKPERMSIGPYESKFFIVNITSPTYSTDKEFSLKITVQGLISTKTTQSYQEVYYVKLIIQEISSSETMQVIKEAENAIQFMASRGFNTESVSALLEESKSRLADGKNKEAKTLAEEIIAIKIQATEVDAYLRQIIEASKDFKKSYLLIGYASLDLSGQEQSSLRDLLSGKLMTGEAIVETLDLAVSAFERGDFALAKERAEKAKDMILLERKGNPVIFFYLYWPFILIGAFVGGLIIIMAYRRYQKHSISEKIADLNKEEETIQDLMQKAQRKYFSGIISAAEYASIKVKNERRLSRIIRERLGLRNRRVRIIGSEKIVEELNKEREQVESEIKKVQELYYKDKKIGEKEYRHYFDKLNERLAEIEDEATSNEMRKSKKKEKWLVIKEVKKHENK